MELILLSELLTLSCVATVALLVVEILDYLRRLEFVPRRAAAHRPDGADPVAAARAASPRDRSSRGADELDRAA